MLPSPRPSKGSLSRPMISPARLLVVSLSLALLIFPTLRASQAQAQADALSEEQTLFIQATSALEDGRPQEAVRLYQELLEKSHFAPELYHNLAVALHRLDRPQEALLQLYRAWALQPFAKQARRDFLSLASTAELPAGRLRTIENQMRALGWWQPLAILALIAFWSGVFLLILSRRPLLRGLGLSALFVGILTAAGTVFLHRQLPSERSAWVIQKDPVSLRVSHGQGAPVLGSLRPMDAVELLAERDGWVYVQADEERAGWLPRDVLGRLTPWSPAGL